jgi:hypothetical protein
MSVADLWIESVLAPLPIPWPVWPVLLPKLDWPDRTTVPLPNPDDPELKLLPPLLNPEPLTPELKLLPVLNPD